jgi:hypothetical protein
MKYVSKLREPEFIGFRCESVHKLAFQKYCDENGFNESSTLRIMLVEFLKDRGVDLDDIKI